MDGRLVETSLPGEPALVPEVVVQERAPASVPRRQVRIVVTVAVGGLRWQRLARNRVLLGDPRAEVDELASIAAERPERRSLRPFDGALAGGAGDDRGHGTQIVG